MKNNKKVLIYCNNFHKIIDFDYPEDDYISSRLISVYQDYIFMADLSKPEEVNIIENLDKIIAKYIDDYFFRKELKNSLKELKVKKDEKVLESIVKYVISTYNRYEEDFTRNIYISRWI